MTRKNIVHDHTADLSGRIVDLVKVEEVIDDEFAGFGEEIREDLRRPEFVVELRKDIVTYGNVKGVFR